MNELTVETYTAAEPGILVDSHMVAEELAA
jgi:hypothetical protein